jgi:acetyl-CoA carboxylase biotin carboxylase subunit
VIRRLLIANRGEIAIRIARGARDLGIEPVGVYSDADRDALFRDSLHAAVRIGPGPASESYLNGAAIIAAARELHADAIHPGYGFLSERAPFAQAVIDAGLMFVGPTPAAIDAMGSKSEAKRRVRAAGVPVVDGYDGDEQDIILLRAEAVAIGVPLVIKAVAGGGGRGMRVVEDLAQFDDLLAAARREAQAAFGDDAVLLERYVRDPRHIEFQILADLHGNIVHVGERECSIQRRHQKVVEEAPSTALDDALRARMGAAAISAARSVGYTNAGTVEFLLGADRSFAFLEMNARLQVEHPVTELVYGVDLVHEQLRIASGEALRITQDEIGARGWSIEVRLNAEDPAHDYAPQAGTISAFSAPHEPGMRVDTGVRTGSVVPPFYDSLLAKLIVWGDDRAAAIARLDALLAQTQIAGIATNLPLLRAIAADDAFAAGATTTGYLIARAAELAATMERQRGEALRAGAAALLRSGFGWRQSGIGIPLLFDDGGHSVRLTADRTEGGWHVSGAIDADITFEAGADDVAGAAFVPAPPPSAIATHSRSVAGSGSVQAPMPGKIAAVAVKPGDTVMLHDLLVTLEAMKMEHRIDAPIAGRVSDVHVAPGAFVAAGASLVTIGAA